MLFMATWWLAPAADAQERLFALTGTDAGADGLLAPILLELDPDLGDTLSEGPILGLETIERTLSWSPEGLWALTRAEDGSLQLNVIDPATRTATQIGAVGHAWLDHELVWEPRSDVLWAVGDGDLHRVDRRFGTARRVGALGRDLTGIAFASDGELYGVDTGTRATLYTWWGSWPAGFFYRYSPVYDLGLGVELHDLAMSDSGRLLVVNAVGYFDEIDWRSGLARLMEDGWEGHHAAAAAYSRSSLLLSPPAPGSLTWTLEGAPPAARVALFASGEPDGGPVAGCARLEMSLAPPLRTLGELVADGAGAGTLEVAWPAGWRGQAVHVQAGLDPTEGCGLSNVVLRGISLAVTPLVAESSSTLSVAGLEPFETVEVWGSMDGKGLGPCLGTHGGLCLDVLAPSLHAEDTADARGNVAIELTLPPGVAAGASVWFQAMVRRGDTGTDWLKSRVSTHLVGG
jgi:hypothetical protein